MTQVVFGCGLLFADGGRSALAVRRSEAAANCTVQRTVKEYSVIPHIAARKSCKMNGIPTENLSLAMPILTSFGGMTFFFHLLPFVCIKGNTKNRRDETISESVLRLPYIRNRFCRG